VRLSPDCARRSVANPTARPGLSGFCACLIVKKVGNYRWRKIGQQNQGVALNDMPNLASFRPQNSSPFATGGAQHQQIGRVSVELERPLADGLPVNGGKVGDDA